MWGIKMQLRLTLLISMLLTIIQCTGSDNLSQNIESTKSISEPTGNDNSEPTPEPKTPDETENYHGYFKVWLTPNQKINKSKRTHIIVVGPGHELNTMFLEAATTKSLKWQDNFPKEQVVLFVFNEISSSHTKNKLLQFGFTKWSYIDEPLETESLLNQLKVFNQIASLEFYTHANTEKLSLGEGYLEIENYDDGNSTADLKNNFTLDAFAFLYGCNAGRDLAPWLSDVWEIPVAGALTSTDLHRLHSNSDFYADNANAKPQGPWATTNPFSFKNPKECSSGSCLRMKPDSIPYEGYWGKYDKGLSFYKFFCVHNSRKDCASRMVKSLLSFPSIALIEPGSHMRLWHSVLGDFICPINYKKDLRAECLSKLQDIAQGKSLDYTAFWGKEIYCDLKHCNSNIEGTKKTSTFAREYLLYLEGLKNLP